MIRSLIGSRRTAALAGALATLAVLVTSCRGSAATERSGRAPCRTAKFLVTEPEYARIRNVVVAPATLTDDVRVDVRPTGSAPAGSLDVVTQLGVAPGAPVESGTVIAHVAGRPVILVDSKVPAYRDIKFGDAGPDVAAIQAMLTASGFGVKPDQLGTAEDGTVRALQRFYAHAGETSTIVLPPDGTPATGLVILPLAEYVTAPSLPGRVVSVGMNVGDRVSSSEHPMLTIGSGAPRLDVRVPSARAADVRVGQAVDILDGTEHQVAAGTVTSVATADVDPGDGITVRSVTVAPDGPVPAGDHLARITTLDAGGDGPVVPSAAVRRSDVDPPSILVTSMPAGVVCGRPRSRAVTVEIVAEADGRAQLAGTPIPSGERVVVSSS